jgi:hypothetical protein
MSKREKSSATLRPKAERRSSMPTSTADLRSSLEQHNATFESLLTLIPPKYYIVNDGPDNQACNICSIYACPLTFGIVVFRDLQNTR